MKYKVKSRRLFWDPYKTLSEQSEHHVEFFNDNP